MNVTRIFIDKYNLTIIFISKVTTSTNKKGFRFTYEIFEGQQLTSKFKSDFITWDTPKGKWLAENYNFRTIEIDGEKLIKEKVFIKILDLGPKN